MGKISCEACKKSCKGQAIRLQEKYFHVKCFKCNECKAQLAAGGFYAKDSLYYCSDDYQRLFGTKCAGCGEYVEGEVITALGATYHQQCFHCSACNKKFGAGDKVTFNGEHYLCSLCLDKAQLADEDAVSPTSDRQLYTPPSSPIKSNDIPLVTSTPVTKNEDANEDEAEEEDAEGVKTTSWTNGRLSNSVGSPYTSGYKSMSEDATSERWRDRLSSEVFETDLFIPEKTRRSRDRLSSEVFETDLILPEERSNLERKEENNGLVRTFPSIEKYGPKFKVNYGQFYNASYLEKQKQIGSYKKAPIENVSEKRPQHFHRPENFSYSKVRTDFVKPMKKGMMSALGEREQQMPTKGDPYKPDKKQEPVRMAKKPDGHREQHLDPIERDDWPGPPCAAVAFPELFYERSVRQQLKQARKSAASEAPTTNGVVSMETEPAPAVVVDGDDDADKSDPKIEREIEELSRLSMSSGAAQVVLRDLKKSRAESPTLDPVSASRAPAADREPHYKTRYDNPTFASPSRDAEYRPRTHSMDDQLCGRKYRNTTLPLSNYPVERRGYSYELPVNLVSSSQVTAPRPGYGLSPRSATLPATDRAPYHSYDGIDGQRGGSADSIPRQHYGSNSSMEEYDPNTGLRRNRLRTSNPSYVGFRRSIPSLYRGEEPPKMYPYDQLLVSNPELPPDVERNTTEKHLAKEEFESIFHMSRGEFYSQPEWKRNDLKRRVGLF